MKFNRKPVLVDVTIRDGGYLNDWKFSLDAICNLVQALDTVGIDIIEVGYIGDNPAKPPAYQCSREYLSSVKQWSPNAYIAAMLNPSKVSDIEGALNSRKEYLDLIRVPSFPEEVDRGIEVARIAKEIGIACSINLISMTAYKRSELLEAANKIARAGVTDWLYFADSRGALLPKEASSLYSEVRKVWQGYLGFHAHNNLGLAADNCKAVLDAGCDLIDCSVRGYGLGGGNTDAIATLDLVREGRSLNVPYREVLRPIYESLDREMPEREAYNFLYRRSGQKNLEQEWVPFIWDAYGEKSAEFLDKLPKKLYRHQQEVVEQGSRQTRSC